MTMKKTRILGILIGLALLLGLMPGMNSTVYADEQQTPIFTFSTFNNVDENYNVQNDVPGLTFSLKDYDNEINQKRNIITKIEVIIESEGAEWAQIQWGYYAQDAQGQYTIPHVTNGSIDKSAGVHRSEVSGDIQDNLTSMAQVQHYGNGKLWWAKVYFNDNTSKEVGTWNDVTNITIAPTAQTLKVGEKTALQASITPSDAMVKKVTWSVANGKVKLYSDEQCTKEVGTEPTETLKVYAKGIASGSETVTVNSDAVSNKTTTCTLTVN